MAFNNDHITTAVQRLLEEHFNTFYQRFESLESRVEEIHSCVRNLQQDSSEILNIVEDLQSSVDATRKTSRKTNNLVRRISQNLNGPNDFSRLSRLKKSPYGSGDSIQTHSASSDESGEAIPPRRSHPPYRSVVGRRSPNNHSPSQGVSKRASQEQPITLRYSPSEPVKSCQNGVSCDDKGELKNDLTANPQPTEPVAPRPSSSELQEASAASRPQGAVSYESPERFLESINIEIRDHNLMSALGKVFKDFPSHPNFPTGLYTILLLDVSNSVNSTIFKQVENFVGQMVDDVENSAADHNLEEMIAVLTFGGHCEVLQHFTNDYMPVKDALEKAHVGGKSPLLFGLIMAMAYCNKFAKRVKVNGHIITPRIIIFTDGYATESLEKNACFGGDYEPNANRVQSDLFKFLPVLEQTPVSVSCVGVGECNQVFLQDIAKRCHGRFYSLSTQNAPKLGRYYLYQDPVTRVKSALSQPGNAQRDLQDIVYEFTQKSHFSDIDKEEIRELLRLDHIKCPVPVPQPDNITPKSPPPKPEIQPTPIVSEPPQQSSPSEPSNIQGDCNIPPSKPPENVNIPPTPSTMDVLPSSPEVERSDGELFDEYGPPCNRCHAWGSRVIRGENWKWHDDQNSPGTVVAHKSEGMVVVKWDCGSHGEYPQDNLYKITEPRRLKHGEVIEVGCSVKRGPDWKRGDEDGGPSTIGTVIRKHKNNTVSVVWPIGIVDRYSFGEREKEVEVVSSDAASPPPMPFAEGPRESDTRQPMEGEVILWQWIDETNMLHTLSKEESAKLEDVYQKKTGTTLVGYKGLQLRCQPTQMKYRDCGGKSRTGKLIRKVCNHDEAETYYCIETL
ncbi:uncharacterized protein LOC133183051 isoform X2 [Saccostrea echinata]|uniref:uncharacterized protein LOC133183051 isoform X2 n=1 Tax=Saccostrea echinata TaxID=191078 RepID=UPI002A82D8CD|nr:uncharacterized protein LOC133183051 isoform X2 [Saccostrea echinata]